MSAPERIWAHPTERQPIAAKDRRKAKWIRGSWKDHDSKASGDVEYVRADLAPQWQPISTAPKDGTEIVIAASGWDCFPVAAFMDYPGNPVLDANGRDVWTSGWGHDCTGFTYGHEDYWLGWDDDPMPTHWMPLPTPPVKS